MKKRLLFSLSTCLLAILFACSCLLISKQNSDNIANVATRTVEVSTAEVDYQSILNEFEDATLVKEGTLTTFEGYKPLSISDLSELDNLSESDIDQLEDTSVRYNFSYDSETNIVTLSAEMKNELGEIEVDNLTGIAFFNEFGEIDAIMEVEGEFILLSEMQDRGLIQNCGWFSRLFKKVVVAVVAVVVVSAAVAAVVATAGAGLGAVIAAGAVAGGVTGAVAGGVISYQETGVVQPWAILAGAAGGAVIGAITGWAVGSIMGVGSKLSCEFAKGSFNSVDDCLNYHFNKHGAEVGARTVKEYSKMASEMAQNVIKNNIPSVRAVAGATPNVFRYELGGKYIHMALNKTQAIIVSFGLI